MKGFIFYGVLFVGSSSFAGVSNFSGLIAQGYSDQAATYARVQAEVESASKEGEVLEELAKTTEAKEVTIQLVSEDQKKQMTQTRVGKRDRIGRADSAR